MEARDLMTPDPACCAPDDTLERAARLMRENDCGALPVCESENPGEPVGMVTDRDLTVRGLADGRGPETPVRSCMTEDVHTRRADDPVRDVEETMARHRIRRVPIIDADGRLIGIIAQADLARAEERGEVAPEEMVDVVEAVSTPGEVEPVEAE